ncbi:sugar phosphate nucleotidyltransferase [Actinopolyspora mortivallis]|nr:sugar phosphate nucleotidyltransferase [Actinopolyspora mortivallis]
MKNFEAVLFAGGAGQRMQPLTAVVPKPLLPFGDEPLLHHVFREVTESGAETARLVIGHGKSQLIRKHMENVSSRISLYKNTVIESFSSEGDSSPFRDLAECDLHMGRPILAAHCDEIVPSSVTKFMCDITAKKECATVILLNRDAPKLRPVRLDGLSETYDTATHLRQNREYRRIAGRIAIPPKLVPCIINGDIAADNLSDFIRKLLDEKYTVVAVEWPGPYVDAGELWRYRKFWKDDFWGVDE